MHPLAVGGATLLVVWMYLRVTSTRSLNPTSIFSWLVSVALGVRGLLSIAILFIAEWISTFLPSNVSAPFTFLFKNPPVMLVFRGTADSKAMKRHRQVKFLFILLSLAIADSDFFFFGLLSRRIAPSGLMQALRTKGLVRLDQAEVIILEGNGAFTVIPSLSQKDREGPLEALENVPGYAKACRELFGETRHKTTEPRLVELGLNQGRKSRTVDEGATAVGV
ncbi:hypothetical protein OIV83_003727 [Microbotryomycetes sp. JL201]|nr:hypothetical protein OIV83_003727 [Microbotryomycetes sp. JL201]